MTTAAIDAPGDDVAVTTRLHEHLGLADRLARRYANGLGRSDDLQQVARIGLLLASRRFDPERGQFTRFAAVTIIGELKKYLRSQGWAVHVPRSLQEDSITVSAARERLAVELGHEPTVGELATRTGFPADRVVEALRAREARFARADDDMNETPSVGGDPADAAVLSDALDRLDPTQRELLAFRFEEGLTQSEIGDRIGISQAQVFRRLQAALGTLRSELEARVLE